jgi:hypothetical protein
MKRWIVCVFLCVLFAWLASATLTIRQFEQEIWRLTNVERAKEGLPALQYDEGLADLARLHSRNMLNFGFFAHKDHLGDMVDDRKRKYYPQLVVSSIGENLARFFNSEKVYTPQELVTGWMNSPEHRENMLDKGYTHLGVGVVNYGDRLIATQNFATPLVKLTSKLEKRYSHKRKAALRFEYMSSHPQQDLGAVLWFPDHNCRFKVDDQHYSVGSKPLQINWLDDKNLELEIDFPAGKGAYEICFGYGGGYYSEGVKLKVR